MTVQTSRHKEDYGGRTVAHSAVTLSHVIMPVHAGPSGVYAHGGEIIKRK